MAESVAIDFVRISILENWRFWHSFGDDYEAAGREAIVQADALLAGDSSNERAARLLAEASEFRAKKQKAGQKGGKSRVARERAARKKNQDALASQKSLPGTSSGNGEALNDEGVTAPAGQHFEARQAIPGARQQGASGQPSTPAPVSAHGDAAEGGLLTPWYGPAAGETFDQETTRADARIREDRDASATVRAQHFDGDAATREGAEAAISGFATSPSGIQKRPGKSATTPYCVEDSIPIHDGGSERGAGGTDIDAVRRSPGAGKEPEVPTLEDLYAFASDACLNEMLCREWWEMTYGDRAGLDRAGRPIRNWKAACRAYVKKRISNMENER